MSQDLGLQQIVDFPTGITLLDLIFTMLANSWLNVYHYRKQQNVGILKIVDDIFVQSLNS